MEHEKAFELALVDIKEEIREEEGEDMEEEMKEDIRKWFFSDRYDYYGQSMYVDHASADNMRSIRAVSALFFRDDQGKFPDYPSDDEGGSAAIFHPDFKPTVSAARTSPEAVGGGAALKEAPDAEKAAAKSTKQSASMRRARDSEDKKTKDDDDDMTGFVLKPSDFVRQLQTGQKAFNGKHT